MRGVEPMSLEQRAEVARRAQLQRRLAAIEAKISDAGHQRHEFFDQVYATANSDPAEVPWADLAPKPELSAWLADPANKSNANGRRAIDIACGLGDHAEALAAAGFATTGFDFSSEAIAWVTKRFPQSSVDYQIADLLELPEHWIGGFDLVLECYTVQSVPLAMHGRMIAAVACLAAPGATVLVYTRTRDEVTKPDGPPWPLAPSEIALFGDHGLEIAKSTTFGVERTDRTIPHLLVEFTKQVL